MRGKKSKSRSKKSSSRNPSGKKPVSVHQGRSSKSAKPKRREEPFQKKLGAKGPTPEGRMVVGVHSVTECFRQFASSITEFWYTERWLEEDESFAWMLTQTKRFGIKKKLVPAGRLSAFVQVHQGLATFVKEKPEVDWESLAKKETSVILALDEVGDPQNLGSLLRTSWLLGVDALVGVKDKGVGLTPSATKVSCGGSEHVPFEEVVNLGRKLEELKELGYWIYGLAGETDRSFYQAKFEGKVVLVVGAEEKGLRALVRKKCDEILALPQKASHASYNASVAGAMALSEVFRQLN